jgi:hypothetical protein
MANYIVITSKLAKSMVFEHGSTQYIIRPRKKDARELFRVAFDTRVSKDDTWRINYPNNEWCSIYFGTVKFWSYLISELICVTKALIL